MQTNESETQTVEVLGTQPGEVAEEIRKAVEKARDGMQGKIKETEQQLQKAEAQLEAMKKARAEAEAETRQATARAAKAEQETTKAETEAREFKALAERKPSTPEPKPQKTPPPKEKPPPPTSPPKETPPADDPKLKADLTQLEKLKVQVAKHEENLQVARSTTAKHEQVIGESQLAFQRALKKIAAVAAFSAKGSKAVDEFLSDEQGKDQDPDDVRARYAKALPALEQWGEEICQSVDGIVKQGEELRKQASEANVVKETPPKAPAPPVELPLPVIQEVVKADPKDAQEILRLNKRLNSQQDEIARLLITIDELRARIESVREIASESSPDVASVIQGTMKKAGLREIIEAKNVPQLTGVFQRLWEDGLQRNERLGLIQERMLIANKAYSSAVHALISKASEGALDLDALPDLDRLSSTAAATLAGMCYNTEFLFRNTCEYAIAQGVESSVMKTQRLSLDEVLDSAHAVGANEFADEDPNSPNYRARRRAGDRLPGRRGGDRIAKEYLAATTTASTGDGRAFWHLPGGTEKSNSPRAHRRDRLADPDPSSFSSYVASVREARGELSPADWPRCTLPERKVRKGDSVEFAPKTLKASISGGSRSLPALPKGRSIFQQTSGAGWDT